MFSRVCQSFPHFLMSKEYLDAQFNLAPQTYNQYTPLSIDLCTQLGTHSLHQIGYIFQSRKRLQNRYCPRRMWLCEISDVVMCKKMWLCRAIAKTDLTASCPSSIMPIGHHAHWPSCPSAIMPIGHHAHRPSCQLASDG